MEVELGASYSSGFHSVVVVGGGGGGGTMHEHYLVVDCTQVPLQINTPYRESGT